eukprot:scaffold252740_cov17-Tisochrysis_lutea.AAC.1
MEAPSARCAHGCNHEGAINNVYVSMCRGLMSMSQFLLPPRQCMCRIKRGGADFRSGGCVGSKGWRSKEEVRECKVGSIQGWQGKRGGGGGGERGLGEIR